MIRNIFSYLFTVRYPYVSDIDRQRARLLILFMLATMVGVILWIFLIILPQIMADGLEGVNAFSLLMVGSLVVFYFIYHFAQNGRLRVATWILLGITVVTLVLVAREGLANSSASLYGLPILIAGLMLSRRDLVLITVIVVTVLVSGGLTQSQQTTTQRITPAENAGLDFAIISVAVAGGFGLLALFSGTAEQVTRNQAVNTERLTNITAFMSTLPVETDEHTALNQIVGLIHRHFPLVGARIYLRDMVGNLIMGSGGEVGQPTLTGEEVIKLTDTNIISEAARLRQPRAVMRRDRLDIRSHHLRPNSNVGIAIPILTEDDAVLGVIDVQSVQTVPFSADETRVLETLARLVAALLMWLRTSQTLSQTENEQADRIERLQRRLAEYEERERRASNAWGMYFQERGAPLVGFNLVDGQEPELIAATDLPETLRPAWEQGELHVEVVGDERIINVPIKFRDTTLGAMSFALPADRPVSNYQLDIAQTVSQRLALALENARLFEQSQVQAQRERAASEFTSMLTGATDVKTALNLAAHNFNHVLGAIHTRVYLQPEVLAKPAQYEDAVK
ncbi:MAG: GAF domain-containing protein [Anaerolineaceae bacterium]|nr:GAF domain-containing protein [Anaerolineaceae bacterium]